VDVKKISSTSRSEMMSVVEGDPHHLDMAGVAATDLFVAGVLDMAVAVAALDRRDAVDAARTPLPGTRSSRRPG
jgi:hypothetical protein